MCLLKYRWSKTIEFEVSLLFFHHFAKRVKITINGKDSKHLWKRLKNLVSVFVSSLYWNTKDCVFFVPFYLCFCQNFDKLTLHTHTGNCQQPTARWHFAVHIITSFMQWCFKDIEQYVKFLHSLNLKGIIWTL